MTKKTDIFVAIDTQSLENAKKLVNQLSNRHCGIKIGKELFTSCGPEIVQWVKDEGFKVFLDLKFHDIPNTVMKACEAASRINVDIINLHTLGGKEMMLAAKNAVSNQAFHGAELPYVFDTHDEWLPFDEIDRNLTNIMISYWVEFAKSGNPNSTTSPSWQIFSPEIQETQILGDNIYNSTHPSRELCEVIFAID